MRRSFYLKLIVKKTYTTNLIKTYKTYTNLPHAKWAPLAKCPVATVATCRELAKGNCYTQ